MTCIAMQTLVNGVANPIIPIGNITKIHQICKILSVLPKAKFLLCDGIENKTVFAITDYVIS